MAAKGEGRVVSLDAIVEEADWPKRTDDSLAATLRRRRTGRASEAKASVALRKLARALRLLLVKYGHDRRGDKRSRVATEEGRWITTDQGNRVFITNDGQMLDRPGGVPVERAGLSERALCALRSYNPSTKEKQDESRRLEEKLAKVLGCKWLGDNEPMDLVTPDGMIGFEIKMVHDGKDDKVHMRPDSRKRKEAWLAEKNGRKVYTIVIDNRDRFQGGKHRDKYSGNKIYYKEGVGAFRFDSMKTAATFVQLKRELGL